MANQLKLTFNLTDRPDLVEGLRLLAAHQRKSQRSILIDALQAFFAQRQENLALLRAANQTFSDWENEEDKVYDSL